MVTMIMATNKLIEPKVSGPLISAKGLVTAIVYFENSPDIHQIQRWVARVGHVNWIWHV